MSGPQSILLTHVFPLLYNMQVILIKYESSEKETKPLFFNLPVVFSLKLKNHKYTDYSDPGGISLTLQTFASVFALKLI